VQPGRVAQQRPPPVAGHGEVRAQLAGAAVGRLVAHAGHPAALGEQPGRLGVHPQGEHRLHPRRVGEQVEKVPLGDEREVLVRTGNPAEVTDLHQVVANLDLGPLDDPVR
jgi:hypothetical protein